MSRERRPTLSRGKLISGSEGGGGEGVIFINLKKRLLSGS